MDQDIEQTRRDFIYQASKDLFQPRAAGEDWTTHQHGIAANLPALQRADAEAKLRVHGMQCFLIRARSISQVVISAFNPALDDSNTDGGTFSHYVMKLDTQLGSWAMVNGKLLAPDLSSAARAMVEAKLGWPDPHVVLDGQAIPCVEVYSLYVQYCLLRWNCVLEHATSLCGHR